MKYKTLLCLNIIDFFFVIFKYFRNILDTYKLSCSSIIQSLLFSDPSGVDLVEIKYVEATKVSLAWLAAPG